MNFCGLTTNFGNTSNVFVTLATASLTPKKMGQNPMGAFGNKTLYLAFCHKESQVKYFTSFTKWLHREAFSGPLSSSVL